MPSPSTLPISEQIQEEQLKSMRWRRRFYAASFIVLLGVILFFGSQLLNVLATPVGIIIWTALIVFCLRGPVNALEKKGVNRFIGTIFAYALMVVVLAALVLILFSPFFDIGSQFTALAQSIPGYVQAIQEWVTDLYGQYSYLLQDDTISKWLNDTVAAFGSMATDFAQSSTSIVIGLSSGIASTLLVVGFALVVAFWVLMELPAMGKEIYRLIGPKRREDAEMLYLTGTRVMGGYIKGTLLQCMLIGLLAGIGFAVMGVPNSLALGIITGILNVIPVIGPWFGGALAGIVGIFVSPVVAVVALVYTIVVQQIVYTFISPRIMGDSVDIHPALIIIALMLGSAIGGASSGLMGSLIGALASIPAVAALKTIFIYYFEKRTGRVIVAPDGVIFKGEPSVDEHNPVADATGSFAVVGAEDRQEFEELASELDDSSLPAIDPIADATASVTGQIKPRRKLELPGSDLLGKKKGK